MRLRISLVLAFLAAASAGHAADPKKKAAEEATPVFDKTYLSSKKAISTGKSVWEEQCRHCHGASAYPGKAPKLNPGQLDPAFIYDRVTFGFGKMPGWKEVYPVEKRKAVVAYIKSNDFSP